jgi:hypothetical protein
MTSSGYVIVRKSSFLGERWGDRPTPVRNLRGEAIYYMGIDRDPWWDLDGLFYEKKLSRQENDLRTRIKSSRLPFFSAGVCGDMDCACQALSLSNQALEANEIIYISTNIARNLSLDNRNTTYMGLDYYFDGYGSVLRLGLFCKPQLFLGAVDHLNDFGLFDSLEMLLDYVKTYTIICKRHGLEPIDLDTLAGCPFSVYACAPCTEVDIDLTS